MSKLAPLLVLMLMAFPGAAGAQESLAVSPGSRVRVWTSPETGPVTGKVLRVEASEIVLAADGGESNVLVRRDAITRLDVSRGRRSRGKNVLVGAMIGLVAAGIALAADTESNRAGIGPSGGEIALLIFPPAGALVGVMFPPRPDRWLPGRLTGNTGPAPSVRFGFRF